MQKLYTMVLLTASILVLLLGVTQAGQTGQTAAPPPPPPPPAPRPRVTLVWNPGCPACTKFKHDTWQFMPATFPELEFYAINASEQPTHPLVKTAKGYPTMFWGDQYAADRKKLEGQWPRGDFEAWVRKQMAPATPGAATKEQRRGQTRQN